jgi:hypothetical protein
MRRGRRGVKKAQLSQLPILDCQLPMVSGQLQVVSEEAAGDQR